MANRIEWWLVEVERRLEGRMPADKVNEIVQEASEHLYEIRDEIQEQEHGDRLAIERFGSPRSFCIQVLNAFNTTPRQGFSFMVCLFATITTLYPLLIFESNKLARIETAFFAIPRIILAALFFLYFLRSSRIRLLSIVSGAVIGFLILGGWMSATYIRTDDMGAMRISEVGKTLREIAFVENGYAEAKAQLDTWQIDAANPGNEPKLHNAVILTFPGMSLFHSIPYPRIASKHVENKDEAMLSLKETQSILRRKELECLAYTKPARASIDEAMKRPKLQNAVLMYLWCAPGIWPALTLLPFLNLLALACRRLANLLPRRKLLLKPL